jgi:hypothetical protein
MDDLELYMQDLKLVQSMNFDKAYLVHSHTLNHEHIEVDAQTKITAYIKYREDRDNLILQLLKV